MLCGYCKKNQATKTYEQIKKGKKESSYYCLDCYHKLFLDLDEGETGGLNACPYCGTTVAELKKRNLVGCANCYSTMQQAILPLVTKMQGSNQRHQGKSPYESQEEKVSRRLAELSALSEKYNAEKDYDSAREYERRYQQLKNGLEEDYVWRNRPLSSKQS